MKRFTQALVDVDIGAGSLALAKASFPGKKEEAVPVAGRAIA
ncbi:MAG: hypothetical protein US25_C0001G0007 [Candidatus Moranbacteria bacterium GW2011_GWE1_36_7]|nr:MAG: hypothetical protein UR99_C0005G0014 [Candidatus Moranbacteria bacterium GW2011_GWD2_36_12]KKQ06998.1 MAG: hypothetical protein US16_C0004G0014 [Candidatus Moranbacteria bacterium GW2011_GWE2_36_40]KKQ15612.1 MAG: hypothetical protein US25_C0001G0007 [Candidatus Moranbacteria bacterium GW2011_GWE1_36_7]